MQRQLREMLDIQRNTNQKFQEEVKTSLAALTAKRAEQERSTRHGLAFEDAVGEFLQLLAQQRGDVLLPTGNSVGLIKSCKKGDFVWELSSDSAAPGAKVVVEAKEDQSYSLKAAIEEISEARKNRGAEVGLFIFSERSAPTGLSAFSRHGNDVFVVWDATDAHRSLFSSRL